MFMMGYTDPRRPGADKLYGECSTAAARSAAHLAVCQAGSCVSCVPVHAPGQWLVVLHVLHAVLLSCGMCQRVVQGAA